MKKTYYLLLFVLLSSTAAKAQTDWIKKNMDEKLSVKFPTEPQRVIKNGFDSYIAIGKDSVKYSTTVIDLNVLVHLDSATLAPIKDTKEFADQMKEGMGSEKGNYTLSDVVIGKWKTYTTYSVSETENTNKNKISLLMIMIGSKLYTFSCQVPAKLVTKNDQMFLSSPELVK